MEQSVLSPETVLQQTVLLFQALVQLGTTGCVQQTDHRDNDSALLNQVYLAFEDRDWITIKSQDKSPPAPANRDFASS